MSERARRRINPLIILVSWVGFCIVFSVIVMLILGVTTPGGEQQPLEFLGKFIYVIVYGLLVLAILTIFLFKKWSKKYWIVQAIAISFCCYLIIAGKENTRHIDYTTSEVDTIIGGKEYMKIYEYYDNGSLRSISFMYNHKKDSIWTTYSQTGKVTSSLSYKDGTLIDTLK